MSLWDIIVWPFARLLQFFYNWTSNYGVSVILFALVVNLVLLPFMAKSKKSMMRTTRLQPRLQELQKKHEGNQQKLQEETMKLYREEGISPMSGCLWSLIPFPILIALYGVIRFPLGRMMGLSDKAVTAITKWATDNAGFVASAQKTYDQIRVTDAIHANWDSAIKALGDFGGKLMDIDYSFLGMNLGQIPNWKIWDFDWSSMSVALPALGLFLIPFISAFLSWLSMKISNMANPPQTGATAASMQSMNILMPLMSIWICFVMPAALGIYWIANSVFGMARDYSLTKIYKKQLDIEDAERINREKERERELERKHAETERLRKEGATERNTNTSKKKLQAQQKQENDERRAAAEKAEKAARRERLGISEAEAPASQVGTRRYARGRAYDPDRFGTAVVEEAAQDMPEGEA